MQKDRNLTELREILPKQYFREFTKVYKEKYTKVDKFDNPPTRQMVYLVLEGKSKNMKIMEVLIHMAERRNEVKKRLEETLSHAQG